MKIEKQVELVTFVLSIAFVFVVGYAVGYTKGCDKVLGVAQDWKNMYDKHINEQWDMINKRDTLYLRELRGEY